MTIHMPPKIMVASVAISLIFNRVLPTPKLIVAPYHLVGLVIIGIGLLLIVLSRRTLESHKTTLDPKGNPTSLLTSGPYRFSRNPIYLGLILVTIGVAFLLASPSAFIGPIIFFVFINQKVIPREEQTLNKLFSTTYMEYTRNVRRWL